MNRGEVVLVDWPYSDLTGSKLRPAVVVQADYQNGILDDTIYVKEAEIRYPRHRSGDRPGCGDGLGTAEGVLRFLQRPADAGADAHPPYARGAFVHDHAAH